MLPETVRREILEYEQGCREREWLFRHRAIGYQMGVVAQEFYHLCGLRAAWGILNNLSRR